MKRILTVIIALFAVFSFGLAVAADTRDLSPGSKANDGTIGGKARVKSIKTRDLDMTGVYKMTPQALSFTAGTGFSLAATATGSVYTINTNSDTASNKCASANLATGTTAYLFTPTAATDGNIYVIKNNSVTSGTTPIILYAGGLPIATLTGTTKSVGEDTGDSMIIQASYNTGISWWVLGYYQND